MLSTQTQLHSSRVTKSPQWFVAVQQWFRQEIVDDDPWDLETLFTEPASGRKRMPEQQS